MAYQPSRDSRDVWRGLLSGKTRGERLRKAMVSLVIVSNLLTMDVPLFLAYLLSSTVEFT